MPTAMATSTPTTLSLFSLLNGVSLYGGFAGSESSLDQRDPAIDGVFPHETILSGDIGRNDAPNIATSFLSDVPTRQDNAYTVVTASGYSQPRTLDGLTITGGNSNGPKGPGFYASCGGGISNRGTAVLTVTNSTISGNSADWEAAGGGIYNSSLDRLTITSSTISGNSSSQGAGSSTMVLPW